MKSAAQILSFKHQEIINAWEKKVRKEVKASESNNRISLHDHVPNILDGIIDIMERLDNFSAYLDDDRYLEIIKDSEEHGRHRATTEFYTIDEIIHEYIIFHRVITQILEDGGITNVKTFNLLKYVIETAMLKSSKAFTESLQEMQHKLIGTLAHDIRNPLAAARMAIEMQNHEHGKERLEKVKNMSYNSVNKAIQMIEGLLENITVNAGEGMLLNFSETNIVKDVKTVYEEAKEIYSEDFSLDCHKDTVNGVFDGIAIRRLLENLISNALKYGDSNRPITIGLKDEIETVKLWVHNYGIPIESAKQQKIFDFLDHGKTQNHSKLNSWGMGLTLVKMVADAHHGSIDLVSNKEIGTKFLITLCKYSNETGKMRTRLNFE